MWLMLQPGTDDYVIATEVPFHPGIRGDGLRQK